MKYITGIITDKKILPITRLNFGRTLLTSSRGFHTLGRFECSGQVSVIGMPMSCKDLWLLGHTKSGLYSVMGTKQIESVYCDYTKLTTDSGTNSLDDGIVRLNIIDIKLTIIHRAPFYLLAAQCLQNDFGWIMVKVKK